MTQCIDHAAGRTPVPGAAGDALDRVAERMAAISREQLQEISASAYGWESALLLMAALANDPGWRHDAQLHLQKIAAGSLPEPPPDYL
jgi:hypothetical protein